MNLKNVLLLDDDRDTVSLYKILVKKMGYEDWFTSFYSANEALEYLKVTDEFPAILLVDINMDIMSGFEFVQEFESKYYQQHPATRIVILSSSVRESDRIKALSHSSVEEFISKPISKSKLKTLFTGEYHNQM